MAKRLFFARAVLSFLLVGVASQAKLAAHTLECPAEDSGALMQASYRAYPDAADLALTLSGYGFMVRCICRSLLDDFVPGTKGAALYLTDHGDFDVIFLLKPQTFDAFEIIERHKNEEYTYSFRGSPRKKNQMGGGKRVYFFKRSNQLFIAWDKQTATSLAMVLSSH